MDGFATSNFRLFALVAIATLSLGLVGCGGSDGDNGAAGASGADGADGAAGFSCWDLNENGIKDPEEDLNADGVVDVLDCNATANQAIVIGDGSELTEEEIEELGRLVATIDSVVIASAPVVEFTVTDSHGNPAIGLAEGVVWFTIAKLVPGDVDFNGGLSHWQSYVNRLETPTSGNPAGSPNVLESALQATNDSTGTLENLTFGKYRYTFATDISDPEQTLGIEYDSSLTTRVGLEIRLDGEGEVPLAPMNPVYDFVPDGGAGSGTKDISDTANCSNCHYQFELHGGPRKTVEYCVTCHNAGTIDQDTGESVDMAYLAHSVHPGEDRAFPDDTLIPYIIWGFGEFLGFGEHDYSEVTYPQNLLYCENCHEQSEETPDGNAWNEDASAKTCGGCHADGLLVGTPDSVTGQPDAYAFNHEFADVNVGVQNDGSCGSCHLGNIATAGPALKIHGSIEGSARARNTAGDNFIYEFISATNTGPGETPVVTFKITDPEGNAYDILTDPEFDPVASEGNAALNLYVQWSTDAYYGGDETGLVLGARINDDLSIQAIQDLNFRDTGYPYRMRLGAIKAVAVDNGDGSFTVPFFQALPVAFSGDVAFALGGHPGAQYVNEDGVLIWDRAAAVSAVFYPGKPREAAFDSAQCNACHERLSLHGGNRNGNADICLLCHNGDAAVCDSNPEPDGSCPVGERQEGYGMGYMVHSIHRASPTWLEGDFDEVTYPQSIANCFTCHKDGKYSVARATARAVSTDQGADIRVWTDDIATTPTATVCGVCHTSTAARGHFESQAGQVDTLKSDIVGADVGLPNGQEACAVCHGAGATFDTATFHHVAE
jgi:OmcA/MtrC family decaheme c-type cytochrome